MQDKSADVTLQLAKMFNENIGTNLFENAGNFIHFLTPILLLAFTTYVVLIIVEYRRQGIDDIVVDLSKKAIFWMFLTAFAANANNYITLANILYNAPNDLISMFSGQNHDLDSSFVIKAEEPLSEVLHLIDNYYQELSWSQVPQSIETGIIYITVGIAGNVIFNFAFGMYLIIKAILAVMLVVGPLFLCFLYFPQTRQWGMAWIGQIINLNLLCAIYIILIRLYVSEVTSVFNMFFNDQRYLHQYGSKFLYEQSFLYGLSVTTFTVVAIGLIFLFALFKIPTILSGILGGGSVEGALSPARSVYSLLKTVSPSSKTIDKLGSNARRGISGIYNAIRSNNIKPGGR